MTSSTTPPTRRRLLRLTAAIAGVVMASLMLSGCLYAMIPAENPRSSASAAPDTEGVSADLMPYYGQTIDWSSCNSTFECATITAPLDWTDPGADTIDLAIIRAAATDGQPLGSLLVNPGGPGASGVGLIRDSLTYAVGESLRAQYDVVGFDPRGVGESTSVTCYEAADMDAYLFDLPQNARGTDAWTAELTDRNQGFGEACDANSGGILPFITTENAARDLDLLRAVLGDTSLNYLGYSYGTFLGATYAKLYPEKAGRLVLDGAIDPSISGLDVSTVQGVGFESALRAYMAWCLEDRDCPFRGSVDDAMADLGTLLASVDRNPIEASDGRMLGADSLVTAIVASLYSQDSWPYLSAALSDAMKGNADTAFQLVDFYYDRAGGTYSSNSTEAFRAYNCMDYPLDATDQEKAESQALLAQEAPTVAPYWSGPDPCEVWPYPATGIRERITADGAAPILVIGTTNDPATPYEWAVSLADQLSSGVLITRVGEGHTGYNKGNSCVDSAVEDYFVDGTVPQDGLRCE